VIEDSASGIRRVYLTRDAKLAIPDWPEACSNDRGAAASTDGTQRNKHRTDWATLVVNTLREPTTKHEQNKVWIRVADRLQLLSLKTLCTGRNCLPKVLQPRGISRDHTRPFLALREKLQHEKRAATQRQLVAMQPTVELLVQRVCAHVANAPYHCGHLANATIAHRSIALDQLSVE
jgi:hypothetical protein